MKQAFLFITIAFGLIFSLNTNAYSFYYSSFDNATTGTDIEDLEAGFIYLFNGTGDTGTMEVSEEFSTSGAKSLSLYENATSGTIGAKKTLTSSTSEAFVEFDFYFDATGTDNTQFDVYACGFNNFTVIYDRADGQNCEYETGSGYTAFDCGTWLNYKCFNQSGQWRHFVNDVEMFFGATSTETYKMVYFQITTLQDTPTQDFDIFIDNLEIETGDVDEGEVNIPSNWLTSFDETQFFPYLPADCENTITDFDDDYLYFTVYGHFTNSPSSTIWYDDLNINFYNEDGFATSYDIVGTSAPNSDLGWLDEMILEKDNYRVEYKATGYDTTTGDYMVFTHYCDGTSIGYEIPAGGFDWWGKRSYLECQNWYDDCIASSTNSAIVGFVETILCKIGGLAMSMVCPSPQAVEKGYAVMDDFRNRFPMSYISIIKDEFNLSTSTLATSTATTSFFSGGASSSGQNTNLSASFGQLGDIDFFSTLRTVFGYFILFGFLLWLVKFSSTAFVK